MDMSFLERNIHYIGLNFVSKERLDPLIQLFLGLLGLAQNQFLYVSAQLLIAGVGMALLLSISRSKGAWLAGVWTAIALLLLVGVEPFYLKVQWFPWMLSAFVLLLLRTSLATVSLCLLFSALWVISASALAPFGILLAALVAVVISLRMRSFTLVLAEGGRSYTFFSLMIAGLFLLSVWEVPRYPMPNYPSNARLTAETLFPFLPFPLIGERLNPNPIVSPVFFGLLALYGQNYLLLLISIAAGIGVSSVLWPESISRAILLLFSHAVAAAAVVFSLLYWPQHHIGSHPFALLLRLVPGMGFVFLPWLLLPFSVLLLGLGLFAHCSRRMITAVVFATGLMGIGLGITGNYPPSQAHFAEFGVEANAASHIGVTWSPSAAVVATIGPWIATPGIGEERDFANMKRLLANRDYRIVQTTASPNSQQSARAVDGNVFSAWHTGRAQASGDFFSLEFVYPVSVAKVALSIQETPRAYPCSLGVWSTDELGIERPLYVQDPWPGPVFWSEDGFPYFGEKQYVVIDFPNRQLITRLRFEILSGGCDNRPWAIGELKFYDVTAVDEIHTATEESDEAR